MTSKAAALRSGDVDEIVDALRELGKNKSMPDTETIDALKLLTEHLDPQVRSETAAIAGIRLQIPGLYNPFFDRLSREDDPFVLSAVVDAATAIALNRTLDRGPLSQLLARLVLDVCADDEVRGRAYLSLLRLHEKITPREYAASPFALSEMDWKKEFVESLTQG